MRSLLTARRLACSNFLRWTSTLESRLSRNRLASSARASAGSAKASFKMSAAVRFMKSILTPGPPINTAQGHVIEPLPEPRSIERLTPRGGPRQKAVVVARTGVPKRRKHFSTRPKRDGVPQ